MDKKTYEEAQKEALKAVYLSIAETGAPTPSQVEFIEMMKPKRTEMDDVKEAGSFLMSMMGFMEGK